MKLVDGVVVGGDQVLHRVWEGLVFPCCSLEGLQYTHTKQRENVLSQSPSTSAAVPSHSGSEHQITETTFQCVFGRFHCVWEPHEGQEIEASEGQTLH